MLSTKMLSRAGLRTASGSSSSSILRTATPKVAAASRSYATVAEEVPDVDPSMFKKQVDMSVIEKGKGFYINYKRIEDNLKVVRQR